MVIKKVENEEIIDDETKVEEELKNFLKTAVAYLDIRENQYTKENVENISDPVDKAIKNLNFIQAFYLSKQNWQKKH